MTEHYLEDFIVGQRFSTGRHLVDDAQIKLFAAEFDPQPFHVDPAAAEKSIFRGLAASGWHTAGITMSLLVHGDLHPAGGIIGLGLEGMQWLRPVRPGDELRVETEILEVRQIRFQARAEIAQGPQHDVQPEGRTGTVPDRQSPRTSPTEKDPLKGSIL